MTKNYFKQNNNIGLRVLGEKDIDTWLSWLHDDRVLEYMNKGQFPFTVLTQKEHLNSINNSKNEILLGIEVINDHSLIGIIGLHQIDWTHRKGSISIIVGSREYAGKGYGTQAVSLMIKHAFFKLNLRKLIAGCWAINEASKKIFLNNGFLEEGLIRESYFYDGAYIDEIRLGLTRSEYKDDKE